MLYVTYIGRVISYSSMKQFFDLIQVCGIKYKPLKLLLYYFHNVCTYKMCQVDEK